MDLDETLAFTALLEMDPAHGRRPPGDARARREALLAAWWAQDTERHFWTFARGWLDREETK